MNDKLRRQAAEYLYRKSCPGSPGRIEAGGRLMTEFGFTPEDIERLDAEAEAELLGDLVKFVRTYIVVSEEEAVVIALWVIHAHAVEAFDVTPYLSITSAEKRSGKSRLLEVLKLLVPNPLHVILPSEAVLFRTINAGGVTLLLDEADAFFKANTNDAQEGVRAVLNAGFERGATVPRCLDRGKSVENFSVFCPKVIAGIGDPPDTVADRSFKIAMRRKKKSEKTVRFRRREVTPTGHALRERCAAYATVKHVELREARPDIPDGLNDRAADAAEPLLATADAIGGPWPTKARAALVALAGEREAEADTLGGRLLVDVRRALALLQDPERVRTEDLLRELRAVEDGPWKKFGPRREPLEADDLAKLLKPYGIKPRQMRVKSEKVRGYVTGDFVDALERYGAGADSEEPEESDPLSPPVPPGTPVPTAQDVLFPVPPSPVHGPVRLAGITAERHAAGANALPDVPVLVPHPPVRDSGTPACTVPAYRHVPEGEAGRAEADTRLGTADTVTLFAPDDAPAPADVELFHKAAKSHGVPPPAPVAVESEFDIRNLIPSFVERERLKAETRAKVLGAVRPN